MPEEDTLGSDMSILDTLLNEELRLVKKYLLDSKGQLKLYHPITQRMFFKIMKGEPCNLLEELKAYSEKVKKDKDEKKK